MYIWHIQQPESLSSFQNALETLKNTNLKITEKGADALTFF